uniref:Sec-independent protein translocase protein TatC n=1 Tax=Geoglobus ahangari TaxID=113653 RepID=A0A7C3UI70_9EURY
MTEVSLKEIAEVLVSIRNRLIRIIAVIVAGWVVSFTFIVDAIITAVEAIKPEGAKLIYKAPLEGLILKLKISLFMGFALASPYIIHLIYRTLKERTDLSISVKKSNLFLYAVASVLLFTMGIAYGYKIMLPIFLEFLYRSAESQGVLSYYSLSEYVTFILLMLCVFGLIFQIPLIMYITVKNGIITLKTFKYYRRHFYVAFFIFAAIVTPPDIFTQLMVGVPMVVFYELSLIIVRLTT